MKRLALLAFAACAAISAASDKPNIVYILADDLGWGEVGAYGQTKIKTPNIDRLAREGMLFTDHYTGAPVCAPARSIFLEGKYSGHATIRDNSEVQGPFYGPDSPEGQGPLEPGTMTIGRMLQDAGYVTGVAGKWGLGGPGSTGEPNAQGFDYWFGYLCQRQAHNLYPTHLWENTDRFELPNEYFRPSQTHEGDLDDEMAFEKYRGKVFAPELIAKQAEQFIRRNHDRPFFLYYAEVLPHLAMQVPNDALDQYRGKFPETPYPGGRGYLPHFMPRAGYAAMISQLDRHVGRLLDALDDYGIADNTIVMFTSDNGPTHDVGGVDTTYFNSAGLWRGRKGSVWEGGIRVPYVVRWPGKVRAGTKSNHVSAHWDMMPTFAEAAGIKSPETDGVSLLPELLGRQQAKHEFLMWEFGGYGGQQAARMGKWKAVRRGLRNNPDAPIQLFDLSADPREESNVADQHPQVVAKAWEAMTARTPARDPKWNDWVVAAIEAYKQGASED